MARFARAVAPDFPHHVTQRGSRGQVTFIRDTDYADYRDLVADHCARCATEVWAYCLMPNHVHLVMVPRRADGLRCALGEAHRRFSRKINAREGWRGHLWQERFHSFVMDEHYLLAAVRYVENNPVRAGLCEHAEDWPWSSARAHLLGADDRLVRAGPLLDRVGDWHTYLRTPIERSLPNTIHLHMRTGRPLGDEGFVAELEHRLQRALRPKKRGPKQSS